MDVEAPAAAGDGGDAARHALVDAYVDGAMPQDR